MNGPKKVIKVFFDPCMQQYLKTTDNPQLKDQLVPVSANND